jgi:CRISPR-associated protein Cmr4
MNTLLIGLLAETFVHVGGGQSEGVVDLPVAREAVTDYPFIPGSGLKGALCDWADQNQVQDLDALFGKSDNAGQLLFSDARLLALPVRSLHSASRWITCPHLWERFCRDAVRTRLDVSVLDQALDQGKALGEGENRIILEERGFQLVGKIPEPVVSALGKLVAHDDTRARFAQSLVMLHDDDFVWFARYGLAVQARNVLDRETKISQNLWYEESLPPDSLLYALISERSKDSLISLVEPLKQTPYLQVGGNETIGQGWLALAFPEQQS